MTTSIDRMIHDELNKLHINPKYKGYQYLYEMIEAIVTHKAGLSGTFLSKEVYNSVHPKRPTSVSGIRDLCNNAIKKAYAKHTDDYHAYFGFNVRPTAYDVVITVVNKVVRKRYCRHIDN